jgi:spore coat polysaccharide biosynthesis predicted glycosyltransferase SpsG
MALAQSLARHQILLVTSAAMPLGAEFFGQFPFDQVAVADDAELVRLVAERRADLVVLDVLDTERNLVEQLRTATGFGPKIVTFEDLGSGAEAADLLVSDLYTNPRVPTERQLSGVRHAILAPSFETLPRRAPLRESVENVLVLFGGTDPANLAKKALDALQAVDYSGKVTLVRGLGAQPLELETWRLNIELKHNVKNIAELMAQADLALSSAGRTLTELASIGVPTICMAQNQKEMGHSHATEANGVVMLGLGADVTDQTLQLEIAELISDLPRRTKLQQQALESLAGRSNDAVIAKIMSTLGLKA